MLVGVGHQGPGTGIGGAAAGPKPLCPRGQLASDLQNLVLCTLFFHEAELTPESRLSG